MLGFPIERQSQRDISNAAALEVANVPGCNPKYAVLVMYPLPGNSGYPWQLWFGEAFIIGDVAKSKDHAQNPLKSKDLAIAKGRALAKYHEFIRAKTWNGEGQGKERWADVGKRIASTEDDAREKAAALAKQPPSGIENLRKGDDHAESRGFDTQTTSEILGGAGSVESEGGIREDDYGKRLLRESGADACDE